MSEKLQRFIRLLRDMFELEKSDLDFGIYRIMNIRNNEINYFINNTLVNEVKSILSKYAADTSQIRERIKEIEEQCETVGVKVEDSKLREEYAEYKALLASGIEVKELENDVYSALYNFFNRYYDEGDFISKRRYKEGVYAIPYEGEEVKLYWANYDQYYIKTSENFRDYSFKVDVQGDKYTIHFKLVDANTEQNNNKESDDKKREFILLDEDFLEADGNELTIKFEYRIPVSEQDDINKLKVKSKLNKTAIDKIKTAVSENSDLKRFDWAINMPAPTEKNKTRTVLEKHLETYIAKNTFDYFIHKDLRGFLNRELDFYIKTEIMHLDDLDTENEVKVDAFLAKVKAIKKVGHTIIDFLAQIEDFQKKLWLKKKFVVETNWCITLDKIDESFYPEIAANDGQRQEWVELYAIDEIEGNLIEAGYSNPLTVEFLQQNKNLVLDTKHFTTEFKERLIASIDNLDEETNGLLIHSENFQALNLLQERYRETIDFIYIDPPYNTNASEIIYKNGYKHSSWNSLIYDRIIKGKLLLSDSGFNAITIDYEELFDLGKICDYVYSPELRVGIVTIFINPKGRQHERYFSSSTEYMLVYAKDTDKGEFNQTTIDEGKSEQFPFSEGERRYRLLDFARIRNSTRRKFKPKFYYPIYVSQDLKEITLDYHEGYHVVYPKNSSGEEFSWKVIPETFKKNNKLGLYVAKYDDDNQLKIYNKFYEQQVYKNIWTDKKYFPEFNGTNLIKDIFGDGLFSYPKSLYAVADTLKIILPTDGIVLDYFAGSGTTGHAAIHLNREDGGNRKYILVEMGNYFNTVTKPRIKKAIYAKDWKDGKPQDRNTGVSQIFKYIRLESYEDTLNNIELTRTPEQTRQLMIDTKLFNEYLISYMLDIESRGSLLNLDIFKEPFDYKMKIAENNEIKETNIDMVETFNYLIGLTVTKQKAAVRYNALPDTQSKYKNAVTLTEDKQGKYIFKTIEGMMPNGENALVIWRNLTDDLAADNAVLDAFFIKYCADTKDREFDHIYVNGDNNLENYRSNRETWKVHLIELEFKQRMFEVE